MSPRAEYLRRIDSLAAMADGWYDRKSKAMTPAALTKARELVQSIADDNPVPMWAYPMTDGGIHIEIDAGPIEVQIEIAPDGTLSAEAFTRLEATPCQPTAS